MIEEVTDRDARERLFAELTGPLRTMSGTLTIEELNAPAWWHGDEDAYEETSAALRRVPTHRRRRR